MIEKKMIVFDDFKCIADKCKFTCCSGWDINVDEMTYEKWKNESEKCSNLLNNLTVDSDGNRIINKATEDSCSFLDYKGLCKVVIENGDEYLCDTCRMFPRVENIMDDVKELTLSCACPEVVDMVFSLDGNIGFNKINEHIIEELYGVPTEIKMRDTIINILQVEDMDIEDKLIISYKMILNILENDEITIEDVIYEIEKYEDINYIMGMQKYLMEESTLKKSIQEVNNLFLDIIENYKEVHVLKEALSNISKISYSIFKNKVNNEQLLYAMDIFNNEFRQYNGLIKKYIISNVLERCLDEDIEEMALSLQLIIIELALVKYSVFLNVLLNEEMDTIQYIKDYIVVFARIIGNNSDAVIEFIGDKFGDIFLECGYLSMINCK